jgi:hypothetical protein
MSFIELIATSCKFPVSATLGSFSTDGGLSKLAIAVFVSDSVANDAVR